jgi:hypothetical protein
VRTFLPWPMQPASIVSHGLAFHLAALSVCNLRPGRVASRLLSVAAGLHLVANMPRPWPMPRRKLRKGRAPSLVTFYRSIRGWPEREAVSKFTRPRMAFAGNKDEFVAGGGNENANRSPHCGASSRA